MSQPLQDAAVRIFTLAAQRNFTRGRKTTYVAAACLYIVARRERTPHLLIDFADALQTPVSVLGQTYMKLVRLLQLEVPLVDPSLFAERFAARLELEKDVHAVALCATRLIQSMSRDWLSTGRRPAGLCGAALLVAARFYGHSVSAQKVASVVRMSASTLKRRLSEFRHTPIAKLSREEFALSDIDSLPRTVVPPAFVHGHLRRALEAASKLGEGENFLPLRLPPSTEWGLLSSVKSKIGKVALTDGSNKVFVLDKLEKKAKGLIREKKKKSEKKKRKRERSDEKITLLELGSGSELINDISSAIKQKSRKEGKKTSSTKRSKEDLKKSKKYDFNNTVSADDKSMFDSLVPVEYNIAEQEDEEELSSSSSSSFFISRRRQNLKFSSNHQEVNSQRKKANRYETGVETDDSDLVSGEDDEISLLSSSSKNDNDSEIESENGKEVEAADQDGEEAIEAMAKEIFESIGGHKALEKIVTQTNLTNDEWARWEETPSSSEEEETKLADVGDTSFAVRSDDVSSNHDVIVDDDRMADVPAAFSIMDSQISQHTDSSQQQQIQQTATTLLSSTFSIPKQASAGSSKSTRLTSTRPTFSISSSPFSISSNNNNNKNSNNNNGLAAMSALLSSCSNQSTSGRLTLSGSKADELKLHLKDYITQRNQEIKNEKLIPRKRNVPSRLPGVNSSSSSTYQRETEDIDQLGEKKDGNAISSNNDKTTERTQANSEDLEVIRSIADRSTAAKEFFNSMKTNESFSMVALVELIEKKLHEKRQSERLNKMAESHSEEDEDDVDEDPEEDEDENEDEGEDVQEENEDEDHSRKRRRIMKSALLQLEGKESRSQENTLDDKINLVEEAALKKGKKTSLTNTSTRRNTSASVAEEKDLDRLGEKVKHRRSKRKEDDESDNMNEVDDLKALTQNKRKKSIQGNQQRKQSLNGIDLQDDDNDNEANFEKNERKKRGRKDSTSSKKQDNFEGEEADLSCNNDEVDNSGAQSNGDIDIESLLGNRLNSRELFFRTVALHAQLPLPVASSNVNHNLENRSTTSNSVNDNESIIFNPPKTSGGDFSSYLLGKSLCEAANHVADGLNVIDMPVKQQRQSTNESQNRILDTHLAQTSNTRTDFSHLIVVKEQTDNEISENSTSDNPPNNTNNNSTVESTSIVPVVLPSPQNVMVEVHQNFNIATSAPNSSAYSVSQSDVTHLNQLIQADPTLLVNPNNYQTTNNGSHHQHINRVNLLNVRGDLPVTDIDDEELMQWILTDEESAMKEMLWIEVMRRFKLPQLLVRWEAAAIRKAQRYTVLQQQQQQQQQLMIAFEGHHQQHPQQQQGSQNQHNSSQNLWGDTEVGVMRFGNDLDSLFNSAVEVPHHGNNITTNVAVNKKEFAEGDGKSSAADSVRAVLSKRSYKNSLDTDALDDLFIT